MVTTTWNSNTNKGAPSLLTASARKIQSGQFQYHGGGEQQTHGKATTTTILKSSSGSIVSPITSASAIPESYPVHKNNYHDMPTTPTSATERSLYDWEEPGAAAPRRTRMRSASGLETLVLLEDKSPFAIPDLMDDDPVLESRRLSFDNDDSKTVIERLWQHITQAVNDSDWDQLEELLRMAQRRGKPGFAQNDILWNDTTLLHMAAWKIPSRLTLLLLEVLTQLLQPKPSQIKRYLLCGDSDGNTPLHLACANLTSNRTRAFHTAASAIDFSIIKNLLLLAPKALEMVNNNGDSPLHLLLASQAFRRSDTELATEAAAEEAIESLMFMVSHLVVLQNNVGLTPIHVAICNRCHERVLARLFAAVPLEAFSIADQDGRLPIHYAAAFGGLAFELLSKMVAASPNSIACQTTDGDTPLHLLVANSQSICKELARRRLNYVDSHEQEPLPYVFRRIDRQTVKLAELLIGNGDDDNSPLLLQNVDKYTPLHCCAIYNAPAQLTEIVMTRNANGYGVMSSVLGTSEGSTALHLAIEALARKPSALEKSQDELALRCNQESNVYALITPQACAIFDSHDRTPLMLAARAKNVSSSVLKTLLDANQASASAETSNGLRAIHLACRNKKTKVSVLKALIEADPSCLSCQSSKGNYPLHEACKHGLSYEALQLLVSKYPVALHRKNSKGQKPWDCALDTDASADLYGLFEKMSCAGQPGAAAREEPQWNEERHRGQSYK